MITFRGPAFALALFASMTLGVGLAGATQRYALPSPSGSGTACTFAAPCDIQTAVNSASANDEVIVNPGTYALGAIDALSAVQGGVSVHGAVGQPRPVITGSNNNILVGSGNAHVSDLIIDQTGSSPNGAAVTIGGAGSIAQRIEAHSTGIHACSVFNGGLIRDSTCIQNSANNGSALFSGTASGAESASARNVTAVSLGGNSYGVRVTAGPGSTPTLNVRNVIAIGVLADLRADSADVTGTAILDASYSNFDLQSAGAVGINTVSSAGSPTNQVEPAVFVGAPAGNYHEAATSPTIDAGAVDGSTGTLDVDGEARVQGTSIDIGADEFTPAVPPGDTTPPQTSIDKGPAKKTKSRKATFTFSSSETGSTFGCKVDQKPAKPCTSPLKLKRLKKGKHKLSVTATDAAGNADATPATYRWKVKKKRRRPA